MMAPFALDFIPAPLPHAYANWWMHRPGYDTWGWGAEWSVWRMPVSRFDITDDRPWRVGLHPIPMAVP